MALPQRGAARTQPPAAAVAATCALPRRLFSCSHTKYAVDTSKIQATAMSGPYGEACTLFSAKVDNPGPVRVM